MVIFIAMLESVNLELGSACSIHYHVINYTTKGIYPQYPSLECITSCESQGTLYLHSFEKDKGK